jgi:hypothetical protein
VILKQRRWQTFLSKKSSIEWTMGKTKTQSNEKYGRSQKLLKMAKIGRKCRKIL